MRVSFGHVMSDTLQGMTFKRSAETNFFSEFKCPFWNNHKLIFILTEEMTQFGQDFIITIYLFIFLKWSGTAHSTTSSQLQFDSRARITICEEICIVLPVSIWVSWGSLVSSHLLKTGYCPLAVNEWADVCVHSAPYNDRLAYSQLAFRCDPDQDVVITEDGWWIKKLCLPYRLEIGSSSVVKSSSVGSGALWCYTSINAKKKKGGGGSSGGSTCWSSPSLIGSGHVMGRTS